MPTTGQWVAGAILLYLLLLARSAWKQGEFRQFLLGLVVVASMLLGIGGFIWAWVAIRGG